jgi:hypothetical protein
MILAEYLISRYLGESVTADKIIAAAEKRVYKAGSSMAYISDVYAVYRKLFPLDLISGAVQTYTTFKEALLKMHLSGKITLVEADMPQTLDPHKLKMSKIPYRSSTFVFVRSPRLAGW